jgi:DNA-binding transcriptional LysR family regulator
MEMHQVRYFLAVAQRLNFTRAAEQCNVAQPSLTRAIKLLEDELGGELFRRERKLTHLTEFGTRMLPYLQQCFDSAAAAKKVAASIHSGGVVPFSIALSHTIDIALLIAPLTAVSNAIPGVELKFLRGTASEVADFLKEGDAEIAIAGPLETKWDRLDTWALFSEKMLLMLSSDHELAHTDVINIGQLAGERFLMRPYCEMAEQVMRLLRDHGVEPAGQHSMVSDHDLGPMLEARLGISILPQSQPCPDRLRRVAIEGLDLDRPVHLYGVAGRPRSAAASAFMKLLRARNWSHMVQ